MATSVGLMLARRRAAALTVVAVVVAVSLVTGWLWPVAVDHGGDTAGNPIARYGPHWLYPSLVTVVLAVLLVVLLRATGKSSTVTGLTAFTAGAAGNLAQWVILGGVSNPVPMIHGSGQLSIGDLCLWVGMVAVVAPLLPRLPRLPRRRTATGQSGAPGRPQRGDRAGSAHGGDH